MVTNTFKLMARQLEERIGVPARLIRTAARRGHLPAIRLGPKSHWLFDPAEVEQALLRMGSRLPEPQPAGGCGVKFTGWLKAGPRWFILRQMEETTRRELHRLRALLARPTREEVAAGDQLCKLVGRVHPSKVK